MCVKLRLELLIYVGKKAAFIPRFKIKEIMWTRY